MIAAVPLLCHLPPMTLEKIASRCSPADAAPGEVIVREGASADRFYAIASGEVDVSRPGVRVNTLGAHGLARGGVVPPGRDADGDLVERPRPEQTDAATWPLVVAGQPTTIDRLFAHDALADVYLAVGYGGEPLRSRHGAPVRLIVPGRRGPWWVKWVTSVEPDDRPSWFLSPLPLT